MCQLNNGVLGIRVMSDELERGGVVFVVVACVVYVLCMYNQLRGGMELTSRSQ